MRIAVVSTNGRDVDEHFGKADRFLIYDLKETGPVPVEERAAEPLSTGDPDHTFDRLKLDGVIRVIGDCQRVYATRIGERPAAELGNAGIVPLVYSGPIAGIAP